MTEREKFEAWFEADAMPLKSNWFDKDDKGEYINGSVQRDWEVWQARSLIATKQTYEPAPYWMNPDFQMPKVGN